MSEELLQRGLNKKPEKIGKWEFKNVAIVSKFYNIWNLSNKNPDEIITNELKNDKVALTCLQFLAKKKVTTNQN